MRVESKRNNGLPPEFIPDPQVRRNIPGQIRATGTFLYEDDDTFRLFLERPATIDVDIAPLEAPFFGEPGGNFSYEMWFESNNVVFGIESTALGELRASFGELQYSQTTFEIEGSTGTLYYIDDDEPDDVLESDLRITRFATPTYEITYTTPIEPVPLPTGGVLLLTAFGAVAGWRRIAGID